MSRKKAKTKLSFELKVLKIVTELASNKKKLCNRNSRLPEKIALNKINCIRLQRRMLTNVENHRLTEILFVGQNGKREVKS